MPAPCHAMLRGLASILLRTQAREARKAEPHQMTSGWYPEGGTTPTPGEVAAMASVLEGRHGRWAAEVAEFFSTFHGQRGDAGRSWAWRSVAKTVRRRGREREKQS